MIFAFLVYILVPTLKISLPVALTLSVRLISILSFPRGGSLGAPHLPLPQFIAEMAAG